MKKSNILSAFAGLLFATMAVSCEGEKDLIIYDGNLPIKTNSLYMVGDATPVGWSIDNPEPLIQSTEDSSIFYWEGTLFKGELKLCLSPGSWDNPFIRPIEGGTPIGKDRIVDAEFDMHAGDPDNKWVVEEEGRYLLQFNMRDWTMSSEYLGEGEAPVIEPIEAEDVYIIGDATPAGWNIDSPYKIEKKSQYIFEFEGELCVGEMKACITTGDWGVSFIRPAASGETIGKNGCSSPDFVFTAAPDNKWNITDRGIYHITFDLENWKIEAEFKGEIVVEAIEAEAVYMIGDACPTGWNIADPYELTKTGNYIFEFEDELLAGKEFKCCLKKGPDLWDQEFIRPTRDGVKLTRNGFEEAEFEFTMAPDNKWRVEDGGVYHLTFDLEHYTVTATFVKESENPQPEPEPEPENPLLDATNVYIVGSATPRGWDIGQATAMVQDAENPHIFTWTGNLVLDNGKTSEMKACLIRDTSWSCPFIRPSGDGVTISHDGVSASDFIYQAGDPDYKWQITEEGTYTVTFDLENQTIAVSYLE